MEKNTAEMIVSKHSLCLSLSLSLSLSDTHTLLFPHSAPRPQTQILFPRQLPTCKKKKILYFLQPGHMEFKMKLTRYFMQSKKMNTTTWISPPPPVQNVFVLSFSLSLARRYARFNFLHFKHLVNQNIGTTAIN